MKKTQLESALQRIERIVSEVTDVSESMTDGRGGTEHARGTDADPSVSPFALKSEGDAIEVARPRVHKLARTFVCGTDKRGYATPGNRKPLEIVLDASEGFIPLWRESVTLRWRFNEASLTPFLYPTALKAYVRELLSDALLAWGAAAPVKFREEQDAWDFEIVVRADNQCSPSGCTLARAFFPDGGRHDLVVYPKMFDQSRKEQVDTMIHETGHIFGLRHFFADVSETAWPSEVYGEHKPFSIMNYGSMSELTDADRQDLQQLYDNIWSGALTNVNGTPIRLMTPYHDSGTVVTPSCMH